METTSVNEFRLLPSMRSRVEMATTAVHYSTIKNDIYDDFEHNNFQKQQIESTDIKSTGDAQIC